MRGGETEGKEETRRRSSEAGAKTDTTTTTRVAEKANTFSASDNRACSNRRSRENKCGNGEKAGTKGGSSPQKRPLCYGSK